MEVVGGGAHQVVLLPHYGLSHASTVHASSVATHVYLRDVIVTISVLCQIATL